MAEFKQRFIRIKTGRVPITPGNVNCVFSDWVHLGGAYFRGEALAFQNAFAGHFIHALSARALGANFEIGNSKSFSGGPGDEEFGGTMGYELCGFHEALVS